MSLGFILLIVLVLFLIGALPRWPHSSNWGYYPSGGLGIVLVVVFVLVLTDDSNCASRRPSAWDIQARTASRTKRRLRSGKRGERSPPFP